MDQIDVGGIIRAAATDLAEIFSIIIVIGTVFCMARIAWIWWKKVGGGYPEREPSYEMDLDSMDPDDLYTESDSFMGMSAENFRRRFMGDMYANTDGPLPGLPEDEYERQRLASMDPEFEEQEEREFREAEDAYWRSKGY